MSKYVVDGTSLSAVADAIRTKGETSASLPFPTGFVNAINAIDTGGGGSGGSANVEAGSFVLQSDTVANTYAIAHSLGEIPDFVAVMASEFEALVEYDKSYVSLSFASKINLVSPQTTNTGYGIYARNWSGRNQLQFHYESIAYTKFMGASTFYVPYYSANDFLKAGATYYYVVGKYVSQ